jgi:asparagine synthase (glutamine-hydrolysing)
MCGIVGAVSPAPVDERVLVEMRDRLSHRGPDAAGTWSTQGGRVALGHRRLSVVDLSADANQPFLAADGSAAIVLNGEIYNFRALRRELEATGLALRTSSDTEVLLAGYQAWGDAVLERLSGMFAFAIWDERRRRLFCARDRAGEKPFHYAEVAGSFVFASELKALLAWPGFRRDLDATAVADFLTFGYVPDPKTIWRCARKLPPGYMLEVRLENDGARVSEPQPYWQPTFAVDRSARDWNEEVADALQRSAAEMSYADVAVGAFLSGGIDSSSVVASLARENRTLRTYTIGFDEAGYDERPWAREVAEACGTMHSERIAHPGDLAALFRDTMIWHYDEPFNDYSYLPTYLVCREARHEITVALSGDGGDEVFAGYPKYRLLARRTRVERALPPALAGVVAGGTRVTPRLRRYGTSPETLLASLLTTCIRPEELRSVARGELADALASYDPYDVVRDHLRQAPPEQVGLLNAMRYLDLKLTLAGGILVKVDRASMAVALEVRPVYLNRRMLDLALAAPPELLADTRGAKRMLKSAFDGRLPASVLRRPKMGFAMPLGRWLRDGALSQPRAGGAAAALVDPAYVRETAEDHAAGRRNRTAILHSLVFLDHWLERWA